MTRKRIRYSELASPAPETPAAQPPADAGAASVEGDARRPPEAPHDTASSERLEAAASEQAGAHAQASPAPKARTPKSAASKSRASKAPEPQAAFAEAPAVDTPKVETLAVNALGVDAPATETPAVDAPAVEVPTPQASVPRHTPRYIDAILPEEMTPRARRNSSPVGLAHALAAAHAAESAAAELAALAQLPPDQPVARVVEEPVVSTTVDLLMFRVGDEHFAVELLTVEEVIDIPVIHHVPEMPPAMLGVVAVRGSLTPVYSPQVALGLPLALRAAVLIFRRSGGRVGVLIDDVDDAISLDLRELRATRASADADNVVLGVVRHEETLVAIVDVDALIAACQQAALQEIA